MGLRCLELRRLTKGEDSRRQMIGKKVESNLKRELLETLENLLIDNDAVMIEVHKKVCTEFINILDEDITNKYDYEQKDEQHFEFRNKEIVF